MRQFQKLAATHLYCSNCGQSMPVREVLLLVLPDGNLYDYRCMECSESVGTRKETKGFSVGQKEAEGNDLGAEYNVAD